MGPPEVVSVLNHSSVEKVVGAGAALAVLAWPSENHVERKDTALPEGSREAAPRWTPLEDRFMGLLPTRSSEAALESSRGQ